MEARAAAELPEQGEWRYEPKWDGFRCLAFKSGSLVDLRAKSGKPLGRYFPEMVAQLADLPAQRCVLDGELVVERDGHADFDALLARLHPAESRIRALAETTPATLILFDLLVAPDGTSLLDVPLTQRRAALEAFAAHFPPDARLRLSPCSGSLAQARQWLARAGQGSLDGVVAKRRDDVYHPGERTMIKVKPARTADCVVGGFRYERDSREVGSLLLGLYNDAGLLDHVGFTATIGDAERPALTRRLEALREPPGFTGGKPGGPSRWRTERGAAWEPLRPELVVEVRFDQVTGERFRHGTKLLRWRPDKSPRQCTFDQLRQPAARPAGR